MYTVIIAATKREARKAHVADQVACGCDADDEDAISEIETFMAEQDHAV